MPFRRKQECESEVIVVNGTKHPLRFIIEPWASELTMAPGQKLIVCGAGPGPAGFEVEYGPDFVMVSGWGGSVATVHEYDDNGSILLECLVRVPI